MSLEELRKSLVQEARQEAKAMLSAAEKQADEKVAAAKAEATRITDDAREKAMRAADAERKERIGASQLKARRITSEAQNRVLQQGLEKIWKEFSELPERKPDYERLMKGLITRAEKEMGKDAVVWVNARDSSLAKKISRDVSRETVEIKGGAIVTSGDGTISIDNSLESLFSQKEDELKKIIYTEIFGGKKK